MRNNVSRSSNTSERSQHDDGLVLALMLSSNMAGLIVLETKLSADTSRNFPAGPCTSSTVSDNLPEADVQDKDSAS